MVIHRSDTILFQGDSITNAFRMPNEINDAFQLGAGYALMAASQLRCDYPEWMLRFENRGVSGNTLEAMASRWQEDCIDLRPDVVSILIGINNVLSSVEAPIATEFYHRYERLLQVTKAAIPGARFILCEPFGLPCGLITDVHIQKLLPLQQAVRTLAEQMRVPFIPLQSVINDATAKAPAQYWLYDGVHPTAAGHRLIAQAWLRVVMQREQPILPPQYTRSSL
jgi:lysophospholipase L1-like esterase